MAVLYGGLEKVLLRVLAGRQLGRAFKNAGPSAEPSAAHPLVARQRHVFIQSKRPRAESWQIWTDPRADWEEVQL